MQLKALFTARRVVYSHSKSVRPSDCPLHDGTMSRRKLGSLRVVFTKSR